MPKRHAVPNDLRAFAREQRGAMTKAEALFWSQVRAGRLGGFKFKRQVPIGPYIADFTCTSARLIVELDGPSHDGERSSARDAARDAFLRGQGFTVLRFSNDLVIGGLALVMSEVEGALAARRRPSPDPLRGPPSPPRGEGRARARPWRAATGGVAAAG